MLVHVHKNILDNINLADELVNRKGSLKQTFRHVFIIYVRLS